MSCSPWMIQEAVITDDWIVYWNKQKPSTEIDTKNAIVINNYHHKKVENNYNNNHINL